MRPKLSSSEVERLKALRMLDILDSAPDPEFDALAQLVSKVFDVPISLVSLVDASRQWSKARVGMKSDETPREFSFCTHAVQDPDIPFIVEDTTLDSRFKENPLVVGDPWIRFYAGIPIRAPGGAPIGTVCVMSPTPRKLNTHEVEVLQALARLANKLLVARSQRLRIEDQAAQTRLRLRTLAHDLASPLSTIKLRLALAKAKGDPSLAVAKSLDTAVHAMERLTSDVAATIHGDDMAHRMILAPVAPLLVAEDVVDGLRKTAEDKGVALSVHGSVDARAMADASALRRVLHNLVSNAIRHTPKGNVTVTITQHEFVHIEVRDDGKGIEADLLARLFQPLAQAQPGGLENFGLGLHISKTLMEAQGGTIQATSEGPGKGATFTLKLPSG